MDTVTFDQLPLSSEVLQAIKGMGFEKASPIQSLSIPIILEGHDVIGQAQTGTGKTAAFGIPMVEKVSDEKTIQGLILCPTRELAVQVAEELNRLLKFKNRVKVLPVYGGQPIEHQLKALKTLRPQIIVGTPGRVFDHIERGSLDLSTINMVVLDEADEMLNMGFRDAIEEILEHVNEDAQMVFFSATMAKDILNLTKKYQNDPKHVQVAHTQLTTPNIEQFYLEISNDRKLEGIVRVLDMFHSKLSVIFCNTKRRVDEVVEQLQHHGYFVGGLHGDMKQKERDRVMGNFRKGALQVLVATDVAARGIDVDDVEAVYNLDLPYDEEDYVHRIGRTGRVGRKGKSYTFVTGREISALKRIAKFTNSKITPVKLPSAGDVQENKTAQLLDKVKTAIKDGNLEHYEKMIEKILGDDISSLDVASALLSMMFDQKKVAKSVACEEKTSESRQNQGPRKHEDRQDRQDRREKGRSLGFDRKSKGKFGEKKRFGNKDRFSNKRDF